MINKNDCKIIQDILPNYADKMTSEATNELIEKHIEECAECNKKLKSMNKEIEEIESPEQKEEIKYLKGFKKRRRLIVIISIFITLGICVSSMFVKIPANIDKFNVEWVYVKDNVGINADTGESFSYKTVEFNVSTEYENIKISGESTHYIGDKEIVIKLKGSLPNAIDGGYYGIGGSPTVGGNDENIEKIYIEGAFGKRKLIWSKEMDVMTEEEWKKWYIEDYIPSKLENTQGIYYKDKNNSMQWIATREWKMVYDKYINK